MPTDAQVFTVKRAREGEIMSRTNVYAVGIGPKFTGGTPTGELAICVMVLVKLPPGVLPPADVLPETYDGVKTDVIAVAPAVPHTTLKGVLWVQRQRTPFLRPPSRATRFDVFADDTAPSH